MGVIDRFIKLLNRPFPEEETRFGSPKVITIVSIFVFLFLYIFQPFGISTIESGKFSICLGFGSMTFIATVIYEFVVGQLLQLKGVGDQWTFGKWIINNLGIMFAISLANFLFARILLFGYIEWELFPHMVYGTFMIGIIPIIVLGWYSLNRQEKKYQNIAAKINQHNIFNSEAITSSEPTIYNIPASQIKYVEALQNYVQIGYVNAQSEYNKHTERATLKRVMEEAKGSSIIRCHRSFLVNRKEIKSITGNAQGLLLTLSNCDTVVPVSRSYVSIFRDN